MVRRDRSANRRSPTHGPDHLAHRERDRLFWEGPRVRIPVPFARESVLLRPVRLSSYLDERQRMGLSK